MADELKPCPFCGGPVKLEKAHERWHEQFGLRQFWGVVCRNTTNLGGTCCMEQVPSASPEAATERWNRRATPSSPVADDGLPELPQKFGTVYAGNYWTIFDKACLPEFGIAAVYTADQVRQVQREAYEAGRAAGVEQQCSDILQKAALAVQECASSDEIFVDTAVDAILALCAPATSKGSR